MSSSPTLPERSVPEHEDALDTRVNDALTLAVQSGYLDYTIGDDGEFVYFVPEEDPPPPVVIREKPKRWTRVLTAGVGALALVGVLTGAATAAHATREHEIDSVLSRMNLSCDVQTHADSPTTCVDGSMLEIHRSGEGPHAFVAKVTSPSGIVLVQRFDDADCAQRWLSEIVSTHNTRYYPHLAVRGTLAVWGTDTDRVHAVAP